MNELDNCYKCNQKIEGIRYTKHGEGNACRDCTFPILGNSNKKKTEIKQTEEKITTEQREGAENEKSEEKEENKNIFVKYQDRFQKEKDRLWLAVTTERRKKKEEERKKKELEEKEKSETNESKKENLEKNKNSQSDNQQDAQNTNK